MVLPPARMERNRRVSDVQNASVKVECMLLKSIPLKTPPEVFNRICLNCFATLKSQIHRNKKKPF